MWASSQELEQTDTQNSGTCSVFSIFLWSWCLIVFLEVMNSHFVFSEGIFWSEEVLTETATLCCLVAESCLTLWSPVDCGTSGSSVFHYLPEFDQIHVHWVDDAIKLFHPMPPSSPFVFNLSKHQSLFQWPLFPSAGQSIGASTSTLVLPMNVICSLSFYGLFHSVWHSLGPSMLLQWDCFIFLWLSNIPLYIYTTSLNHYRFHFTTSHNPLSGGY